jgi:hypothetical protein
MGTVLCGSSWQTETKNHAGTTKERLGFTLLGNSSRNQWTSRTKQTGRRLEGDPQPEKAHILKRQNSLEKK